MDNEEEKKLQIKLMNIENGLIKDQIFEKDKMINEYKIKCREQKQRIVQLRKQINEINNDKEKAKLEKIDKMYPFDTGEPHKSNNIKKIPEELKIKDRNSLIDKIETIKFDIDKANFFQCGICMDSFYDEENVKSLLCGHIFHNECLKQWIQTNNNCPFCNYLISY